MKNDRFSKTLRVLILALLAAFPATAQPLKVACIGDSNTRGYGTSNDGLFAYPIVLGRLLGTNYQVRNFGVNGTTLLRKGSSPNTPYWVTSQFANLTNYSVANYWAPNIVTIMLGTNDSTTNNWRYKDFFAGDLADMINILSRLPSHPRVFVCAPVPAYAVQWDITPDVIRSEVIPIIKRVAKEKNVTYINTHTPLTGRLELYISDFIHPNDGGEALMARTIHGAILTPP